MQRTNRRGIIETVELTAFADDLDDDIRRCGKFDREIDEDEQRAGEKGW